jgi:hypothetical protein
VKVILTTYDTGFAKGFAAAYQRGQREALRQMVIRLATKRCGPPDADALNWLHAVEDVARLMDLVEAACHARSWQQLLASP